MKFEVERHIPFAVDEVIMDYSPFVPADELPDEVPNMKVLLAVAQEELVLAYIKTLAVAGLTPAAIDVQVLAGMRALVDAQQAMGAYDQTLALVSMGASTTDIAIVDRGILSFARSVPLGGDALSSAIADQLGRSLEEAEELKIEQGRVFLDSVMGELPSPGMVAPTSDTSVFGAAPAVMAPVVPPPQSVFSLDDAFSMPGPLTVGAPETPAVVVPPPSMDLSTAFSLDAEALDEPDEAETGRPVFSLDDEPSPAAPSFSLGEPSTPPTDEPLFGQDPPAVTLDKPVVAAPEPLPREVGAGPVFDLGAELSGLMPAPLARPVQRAEEDDAPSPFTLGGAANGHMATGPGIDTPPPLFSFDMPTTDFEMPAPETAGMAPMMDATQIIADPAPFDFGTPTFAPSDVMTEMEATAAFSRPDDNRDEVFQRRVFEAMLPTLGELVTEVRRSLEYHASREPERPVERILIYGGTSRLPGLAEFIQHEVGVTVELADPLLPMDLSSFQQPQEYLQELSAALPVAVGLGMRDMLA
jgi:Tfp pilus assembly PilM family ATPase